MISQPIILKMDTRGRVRTPVAQREGLLDAFERSGLSGMKFAALHGVKYPSFAGWVQRRKRRQQGEGLGLAEGVRTASREADSGGALRWWEAVVGEEAGRDAGGGPLPGGLLLHLPGGMRMEITAGAQVGWAAQLLQSLTPGGLLGTQNPNPLRSC